MMLSERDAISYILANEHGITEFLEKGINSDYFLTYNEAAKFIFEFYSKYNKLPSEELFISKFPEVDLATSNISPVNYLIEDLLDDYLFEKMEEITAKTGDLANTSSDITALEVMDYLQSKLQDLRDNALNNHSDKIVNGLDIVKKIEEQMVDKINNNEGYSISTGFKELDDILGGWRTITEGDLIVLLARINQGKSWFMLKFASQAILDGKKVLFYAGEMSDVECMYRLYTLIENVSNRDWSQTPTEYELKQFRKINPTWAKNITILTNNDLDTLMLKSLIKHHKPELILLDQLSLINDYKKARELRLQYKNIMTDLLRITEELKIPIIVAAQANRESISRKDKFEFKGLPENPELHNIGESDNVGQLAHRVISLVQFGHDMVKLKVVKNRKGANGLEEVYCWDIDSGIFRCCPRPEAIENYKGYLEEMRAEADNELNTRRSTSSNVSELKPRNNNRRNRKMKEDLF